MADKRPKAEAPTRIAVSKAPAPIPYIESRGSYRVAEPPPKPANPLLVRQLQDAIAECWTHVRGPRRYPKADWATEAELWPISRDKAERALKACKDAGAPDAFLDDARQHLADLDREWKVRDKLERQIEERTRAVPTSKPNASPPNVGTVVKLALEYLALHYPGPIGDTVVRKELRANIVNEKFGGRAGKLDAKTLRKVIEIHNNAKATIGN